MFLSKALYIKYSVIKGLSKLKNIYKHVRRFNQSRAYKIDLGGWKQLIRINVYAAKILNRLSSVPKCALAPMLREYSNEGYILHLDISTCNNKYVHIFHMTMYSWFVVLLKNNYIHNRINAIFCRKRQMNQKKQKRRRMVLTPKKN